jgi:hypothetical protein
VADGLARPEPEFPPVVRWAARLLQENKYELMRHRKHRPLGRGGNL